MTNEQIRQLAERCKQCIWEHHGVLISSTCRDGIANEILGFVVADNAKSDQDDVAWLRDFIESFKDYGQARDYKARLTRIAGKLEALKK